MDDTGAVVENGDGSRFDAIVIGTGFGGSVVACRLAEAGKRICVLERGRRYDSETPTGTPSDEPEWSDFPKLPGPGQVLPDPRRWLWDRDQGLWDVKDRTGILTVQAAGYGGGSLIYANVHLRAREEVFERWPFSRDDLDPYYNLAAYMLNVKPITEALDPKTGRPTQPEKTDQFQKAAAELHREEHFFYPPLAINFGDANDFNRPQRACNFCGECCSGCRYRAKNTLDLNYLARVDDSEFAEVFTQAEVTKIAAQGNGYLVTFRDHLRKGKKRKFAADAVFVCAGAITSTGLLWRSVDELPNLNKDALGTDYYPNADAIGVVYDAKTPGAQPRARKLAPTEGPTITAAVYHQQPPDEDHQQQRSFLLEDGGFPIEFARHMGLLRAPTLLRRNRHDDRRLREGKINPVQGAPAFTPPTSLTPPDEEEVRSLFAALYRVLRNESDLLWSIGPKQLTTALDRLEAEIETFSRGHLESFVPKVLDEMGILGRLIRFFRFLGLEKKIVNATDAALRNEYLGNNAEQRLELASKLAQWLGSFDDANGANSQSSMVLLAMGIDSAPGKIKLKPGDPRYAPVVVELPKNEPMFPLEESLMRDVACALGGELRVNPMWSFAQTPVTVHSQGGCPMSEDATAGVTDPYGQVHGHPGLFVMDAAAFPAPVGVNPAATILAVAERNIAHLLGDPDADMAKADAWWAEQTWTSKTGVHLEPPPIGTSVDPVNKPVGIGWIESMSGFHDEGHHVDPGVDPRDCPSIDVDYEAAEAAGRRRNESVSVKLQATIPDLASLIRSDTKIVRMRGTGSLTWGKRAKGKTLNLKGTLTLPPVLNPDRPRQRLMKLDLRSEPDGYRLHGYKRLSDKPSADAWRDTSVLYLTLEASDGAKSHGVIRLSLNEFLYDQLPSFEVTNTDDPARIVWAHTSFIAYFFGAVQRVYAPELREALERFMKLEIR